MQSEATGRQAGDLRPPSLNFIIAARVGGQTKQKERYTVTKEE